MLFGGLALVDVLPAQPGLMPAATCGLPSSWESERSWWPVPCDATDPIVIGGAVLIVGLLLILAGLVSARFPGGATFAPSGIVVDAEAGEAVARDHSDSRGGPGTPSVRFCSPRSSPRPGTRMRRSCWGPSSAFSRLRRSSRSHRRGSRHCWRASGLVLIALGIEGSRLVARIERRRVDDGQSTKPRAHPYRPLRGGVLKILRAEFGDESRWRDVLYVAINLPLSIIEFVVVGATWGIALMRCSRRRSG